MIEILSIVLAGTAAGFVHAVTGPDHLAAVAPFAIGRRRSAWRVGVGWGAGHALSVVVIAGLAFFLRELLPLDAMAGFSERIVGAALIAIGLWTLRTAARSHIHIHEHEHSGVRHVHVHTHRGSEDHNTRAHAHRHLPFGIGALHGLAGSSHLIGVLPALVLPGRTAAALYVVTYGVGTMVAMTVFASLLGRLSRKSGSSDGLAYRRLLAAAGAAAVAIGGYWLVG